MSKNDDSLKTYKLEFEDLPHSKNSIQLSSHNGPAIVRSHIVARRNAVARRNQDIGS